MSYPLARPVAFASLSISEIDVIEGVMMGLSQREVARRQKVSPRTVANQLASAYRKLHVKGLVELAALCTNQTTKAGNP